LNGIYAQLWQRQTGGMLIQQQVKTSKDDD
jgi:ATP-binding cassette subfamily B multidrug efflux pump